MARGLAAIPMAWRVWAGRCRERGGGGRGAEEGRSCVVCCSAGEEEIVLRVEGGREEVWEREET